MEVDYQLEQYFFNGTPAQFGREVKLLIVNGDERRQPRQYIAPDYARYRPYYVHLLNQERTEIIGRVATRRDKERSILSVSWPAPFTDDARRAWDQLQADLASLEWRIESVPPPPPTDAVFEEYYRRRQNGQKVTLKEIAQEKDYSADYLRRVKSDYDRRTGRTRNKK